jgi:hypothetical protein
MLIEGPFTLAAVDDDSALGRELQLSFTEGFRTLSPRERARAFEDYLERLEAQLAEMDEDAADRPGMLAVQQIAEELLPHIIADEIPLEQTIVIEIRPESPLMNFVMAAPADEH